MNAELLPALDPDTLVQAVSVLKKGGLVAFPTDTVYGVGALAFDDRAVRSIYVAKERPVDKSIPVLIADLVDVKKVSVGVPDVALRLAERFWPGPLTLVLKKHSGIPESVSATTTVGIRIPDHPVARALLRKAGPLAVTSANLSGRSSPTSAQEVLEQLGERVALILDGGRTPGGIPSTVVDCTQVEVRILREGPVTMAEIKAILGQGL